MTTVAVIVLVTSLGGAAVTGLVIAGRWVLRHDAERTAAATFEADFIPDSRDVLHAQEAIKLAETEAVIEETIALLVDARAQVERLRRAA